MAYRYAEHILELRHGAVASRPAAPASAAGGDEESGAMLGLRRGGAGYVIARRTREPTEGNRVGAL